MTAAAEISRSIEADRDALGQLADALPGLDGPLQDALDLISKVEGRLIVTGLGKSGHIGRKLAATFASTGTPAYFLHPAEASHGDLGMVTPHDAMLILSWSGETRELSDVIGYAKRHSVPIVSLTGEPESTLARASSVALVLPKVREACPHNLAPTTSTLLQLALGDALAIALLERRGFSEESFHRFHPGGSLGAALKSVDEVMHTGDALPLVDVAAPVIRAISEVSAKGQGIVGVTEGGKLCGVVTDGDVRRYLEKHADVTMQEALHQTPVREIMTKGGVTLRRGLILGEALALLQSKRISAAFVVEDGAPVGLITLLRLLNRGAA